MSEGGDEQLLELLVRPSCDKSSNESSSACAGYNVGEEVHFKKRFDHSKMIVCKRLECFRVSDHLLIA